MGVKGLSAGLSRESMDDEGCVRMMEGERGDGGKGCCLEISGEIAISRHIYTHPG